MSVSEAAVLNETALRELRNGSLARAGIAGSRDAANCGNERKRRGARADSLQ